MTLKSLDGKEFPCHKCVLCARLGMCVYFYIYLYNISYIDFFNCHFIASWTEMPFFTDYFHSMLNSSWIEVSFPKPCVVVCFFLHQISDSFSVFSIVTYPKFVGRGRVGFFDSLCKEKTPTKHICGYSVFVLLRLCIKWQ